MLISRAQSFVVDLAVKGDTLRQAQCFALRQNRLHCLWVSVGAADALKVPRVRLNMGECLQQNIMTLAPGDGCDTQQFVRAALGAKGWNRRRFVDTGCGNTEPLYRDAKLVVKNRCCVLARTQNRASVGEGGALGDGEQALLLLGETGFVGEGMMDERNELEALGVVL